MDHLNGRSEYPFSRFRVPTILLGSPVSHGALSQIGKRSRSSGSGRRLGSDLPTLGALSQFGLSFCFGGCYTVQLRSIFTEMSVSVVGAQRTHGN